MVVIRLVVRGETLCVQQAAGHHHIITCGIHVVRVSGGVEDTNTTSNGDAAHRHTHTHSAQWRPVLKTYASVNYGKCPEQLPNGAVIRHPREI